jgi:hypothetical protein
MKISVQIIFSIEIISNTEGGSILKIKVEAVSLLVTRVSSDSSNESTSATKTESDSTVFAVSSWAHKKKEKEKRMIINSFMINELYFSIVEGRLSACIKEGL